MGAVNAVVPHAELEATALEWAAAINAKSPTAQRMLKYAFNLVDDGLVGQQLFAGEATRLAYGTEEAAEGRDAFLEKRPPDWSARPTTTDAIGRPFVRELAAPHASDSAGAPKPWRTRSRLGPEQPWTRPTRARRAAASLASDAVVRGRLDTVERRQRLGLLCLGPDAVLSHEAAARLHGFDRCRPTSWSSPCPDRRGVRGPFIVHTTNSLAAIDRVTIAGWPCTSATRTVIDLARARVDPFRLDAAVDSAVRSGASDPLVLAKRLQHSAGRGRWGVPQLDGLLVDAGGHSVLRAPLPADHETGRASAPTPQVIHRDGDWTYARVDFFFEAQWNRGRGLGTQGPQLAERAGQRRSTAQRATRRRPAGVRIHVGARHPQRPEQVESTMRSRLIKAGLASRHRDQTRRPRARLMTRRWISLVPSPISRILASR